MSPKKRLIYKYLINTIEVSETHSAPKYVYSVILDFEILKKDSPIGLLNTLKQVPAKSSYIRPLFAMLVSNTSKLLFSKLYTIKFPYSISLWTGSSSFTKYASII